MEYFCLNDINSIEKRLEDVSSGFFDVPVHKLRKLVASRVGVDVAKEMTYEELINFLEGQ